MLCNRLPGFCALVVREDTPFPLSVGCMADGLPELTRKYLVMVTSGHGVILLLDTGGGTSLPGGPFRLGISHQARVQTPFQEVYVLRYPGPDILGPVDVQRLRANNMEK